MREERKQKTVNPAAWNCNTYCFGGADATPRRIVFVDTTPTDGEEGWNHKDITALNKQQQQQQQQIRIH